MYRILRSPLFWLGIILRICFTIWGNAQPAVDWYVPFMRQAVTWQALDPWSSWLSTSGDPRAFPYGLAMYLVFLPFTVICAVLRAPEIWGYFLTLFAADCLIFALLRKRLPNRERLILATYWLSPILLVATYWLGRNDIVPVAFLMAMLLMIRTARWGAGGLMLAAAISAKMSMLIAAPFVLIYFLHNPTARHAMSRFAVGVLAGLILLFAPVVASHDAIRMLLENPETGKVLALGLTTPQGLSVYLVPLVYVLMLYATWRIRRINYPLLESTLGLSLLALVLLTPASPGWFVWVVPFLVIYQASDDGIARLLVAIFGGLYVVSSLVIGDGALAISPPVSDLSRLNEVGFNGVLDSLLHTSLLAVGLVLALRAWREGVQRNDFLRLSRRPFMLGIAGDSGSGKDTLSRALAGVFGSHSVTTISGDDYHLWDRQRPIWQALTHLNPNANDLERYVRDVHDLMERKSVYSRHYDHETGLMSRHTRIRANDFLIASGLHALYFGAVRELCSVTVYLDMDDQLRRHLKQNRDVNERGHSLEQVHESLERRHSDAIKFVHPQKEHADLIFSVQPLGGLAHNRVRASHSLRLLLVVESKEGLSSRLLTRVLVGVCGLHVESKASESGPRTEFTIEGDCSAEDIALAVSMACPRFSEFLDPQAQWLDGLLGIMQLLTLMQAEHAMNRSLTG